ncbi:MAG: MFS transporter [Pseudomonadota bacterium]
MARSSSALAVKMTALDDQRKRRYTTDMRLPPALQEPQYRTYVIGNFFSLQGMWALRTVIAWLAWELSGSATWVGIVAFLSFAPTLVSGPIFGVYADRADLRKAAMVTQGAMAATATVLFLIASTGLLTLITLALVSTAQGIAISAHHPVRLALTPRLAPRAALANAIAISSLNFNLARLTGPALGGYGLAVLGAEATILVTVFLFAPVILLLSTLQPRAPNAVARERVTVLVALTDGARHALAHPGIRDAMLLTTLFALVVRGFLELLPVIADGVFQRGPVGLGEIMAAAGAGALTAAMILSARDQVTEPRPPLLSIAAIFTGLVTAALTATTEMWPLALCLVAITGFCGTIVGVTMQSVVQLALTDEYRGRVMSLWVMVGVGAAAIGGLLMGVVADLAGFAPTIWFASGLAILVTSGMFLRRARTATP